jgi:hypothetical protein
MKLAQQVTQYLKANYVTVDSAVQYIKKKLPGERQKTLNSIVKELKDNPSRYSLILAKIENFQKAVNAVNSPKE